MIGAHPYGAGLLPFGPDPQAVPSVPAAIPCASAVISPCGLYRYRLEREGYGLDKTAIIMVNPSTADATKDDATIRKLLGFGRRNAWGRIIVGNLFAYRATDVRELAAADDPVGPENDAHLKRIIYAVPRVIFAWGPTAKLPRRLRDRWREVDAMVRDAQHTPYCIAGPANDGQPRHPLMLPYAADVVPWTAPAQGIETATPPRREAGSARKGESPVVAISDDAPNPSRESQQ